MAALLALLAAAAYGAADFLGGLATRRLPPVAVVLRTNFIGLAGLVPCALLLGDGAVPGRDLAIGAAGGISVLSGLLLLYRGLARGVMSVFAPVTAVLSAVVPVVTGLATGERPSVVALAGIPLALAGIALLAREPRDEDTRTRGLPFADLIGALGAGVGFGLFFVALDATSEDAGIWPVVAARAASMVVLVTLAATTTAGRAGPVRARAGTTPWLLVGCGLLDAGANALVLLATQRGLLTLVAVLAALYPASTLVLARVVLGERLAVSQRAGLLLAGTAVVLVTAG